MPTRLYASSIDVPKNLGSPLTPSFNSSWSSTNNMVRYALSTSHTGSGLTTLQRSKSSSTRQNLGLVQLTSPPLEADQVITSTDTVRAVFEARENVSGADCSSKMSVRVVSQDGTIVRTTLLALDTATTNIFEWGTTSSSKLFPRMTDADPLKVLSDYTTQDGDRIVVELGFLTANTTFTTSQGKIVIGDPIGVTDFEYGNNLTGTHVGWVEFSMNLSFKTSISPRRQRMQMMGVGTRRFTNSYLPKELITVSARGVNSFLNFMGINSHDYGAPNIYSNRPALKNANEALGIPLSRGNPLDVMVQLPAGWKTSMLFGLPYTTDTATITAAVIADLDRFQPYYDADRLSYIEMPNEPDLFTKYPGTTSIDPNWPQYLAAFYKTAYALTKDRFPNIPVLGSSLGHNTTANVTSVLAQFSNNETPANYCDIGCLHAYPGPNQPHVNLDEMMQVGARLYPGHEIAISETGYHTAYNAWQIGAGGGLSEAAHTWYLPKMYLEYFKRGFKFMWAYELLDRRPNAESTSFGTPLSPAHSMNEANFGLFRGNNNHANPDVTGPKPVVEIITNLRSLLAGTDPVSNSTTTYQIDGSPLKHLLLEKTTHPVIVLWQQATIYTPSIPNTYNAFTFSWSGGSAGVDLSPPDQNATVRFSSDYQITVKKVSDNGASSTTLPAATVHHIAVPAKDILILELTPVT